MQAAGFVDRDERPKKSLKRLIHNDIEKCLPVDPGTTEGRLPCTNKQQVPGLC
jgi:hypothetical protein